MAFLNACTGKVAHKSYHSAEKNRREMVRRHKNQMNVYRCGHCGLWHVGHRLESQKRPLRVYATDPLEAS